MKVICSFDNVACLIDNFPDTAWQWTVIGIAIATTALIATIWSKKL